MNHNLLSGFKQSLFLGTGLMVINLLISMTLVVMDFSFSAEANSLVPEKLSGFGQVGSVWFTLMSIGWLAAILTPLGVFVIAANRTLPLRNSIRSVSRLDFSNWLRNNLSTIQSLVSVELAWTPGAALSVLFIATLGRGEFADTRLVLAPITCRVLTSFGAAIGLCTASIFAAILGTFLGSQLNKLWSVLTVGFVALLPILLLMLAGSNDALVAGVCLNPAPFAAFLAAFVMIGPAILSGGFIWLGYRSLSNV